MLLSVLTSAKDILRLKSQQKVTRELWY